MDFYERLLQAAGKRASGLRLETLSIGLGYTAACVDGGGLGVAFTPDAGGAGCSLLGPGEEYEGRPAQEALELLCSQSGVHRAIGLAVANAVNHAHAMALDEDRDNAVMLDALGIGQGTRVAMAGLFKPLVKRIRDRGAELAVGDRGKGIGDEKEFKHKLGAWAEAAIITSTSIVNNSLPELLGSLGPDTKTALVGPSTPLLPEIFSGLGVHLLAGTVPMDREALFKAIRHAKGTPVIQRFSRKVLIPVQSE